MKVLLLNSSAKKGKSRSLRVSQAFIEGLSENTDTKEALDIVEVNLFDKQINDCMCCYHCWKDQQGTCIHKDDMKPLLHQYLEADLVIWSFPLLFYGIPSKMKTFMERLLPLYEAKMKERPDGGYCHLRRYPEKIRREVFISTCAFPSEVNNYEAVRKMVRIMFGENADCIFCAQSTLFDLTKFEKLINRYMKAVKESGKSFSIKDGLDEHWGKRLSDSLLPNDLYMSQSNNDCEWLYFT